ncbi:hypothetical protein ATO6_20345 [Oceanicola sp. 22II-s10i]|uniref:flagellin n=1 Tax=Oceanicola sp. 22II-s10i TaxID=1317116 RepID=UPI000B526206|nr:flagellin [Oceanicola sp. 22II-s10i]OWU83193.1 hypothetical protein ATO6_20345 [Oceanicola sp. 22II-s10i]
MLYLVRSYSTLQTAFARRQTAADINQQLATAQNELSTGIKNDIFKSLGTGAAESITLRASIDRDTAQVAANGLLTQRLDTMAATLGTIRNSVQEALDLAIANKTAPLGTASGMQQAARAALDTLVAQANSSHAGMPLFAGISASGETLQPWEKTNAGSGLAPAGVLASILSGGLPDEAAAQAAIAELNAVFSDTAADGPSNFEQTFYNGAPTGSARQTASTGEGTELAYGVQANDPGFREVLKGLAMLASVDVTTIADPDAYAAWVGTAVNALSAGNAKLLDAETQVGAKAGRIEAESTRMKDRIDLYKNRVLNLEGIDDYEAATRITLLETQLQASYAVTARMSQLSFLNYLR